MKKLHVLSLAAAALMGLVACGTGGASSIEPASEPASEAASSAESVSADANAVKVGLICLHDENSTYDANFIKALNEAVAHLGSKVIFDQTCLLTGVDEDNACYEAAKNLVGKGCNVIFADSFGHDSYMLKAAKEYPNVQFCHATGTGTTVNQAQANYHNAFAAIYEGRYLAGFAAGLKLVEQYRNQNFPTAKVGYVGAYPYAEVKSGYTSWFLGLRSALSAYDIDPNKVTMDVRFTNNWYDPTAEQNAANALIQAGCVLISQHADSMGAPGACELAEIPNVTYNIETKEDCPDTYLAYSRINWAPYYEAVVNAVYNGTSIENEVASNWTGTLATDSVQYNVNWENLTDDATRLADYKAKLGAAEAEIKAGTRKVFDTANFTLSAATASKVGATIDANGHVTSYKADVIDDGTFTGETEAIVTKDGKTYFAESEFRSAPYFDLDIEGINLPQA